MKVNRIRFAKLKQEWLAKLSSIYAFKGIKDYDEWAIGASDPLPPPPAIDHIQWVQDWTGPEEFFGGGLNTPKSEKELLLDKAREIRRQLDEAIDQDDFERAQALQNLLDVIEIKYNKL